MQTGDLAKSNFAEYSLPSNSHRCYRAASVSCAKDGGGSPTLWPRAVIIDTAHPNTLVVNRKPAVEAPSSVAKMACTGCAISERREFLQTAVRGVGALLGLSALHSDSGFAQIIMPVAEDESGSGAVGSTNLETRYPIPAADGVSIDSKNDVIIARVGDSAYAFALACPHQNTALRWLKKDNRFQCPKHQSKYKPSGEFISGRATRNMDRLPIRLEGTTLVVDTSREIKSDADAAQWAAAVVKIQG